jgi:HPt (histidine-containing phosphotransfer) domain-containing protein
VFSSTTEVAGHAVLADDVVVTQENRMADLPVEVLDATVLDELLGTFAGQNDVVASLYARFFANAARYIDDLRDSEGEATTATLHTLKGCSAMMGALRISALATRLHEASLRHSISPTEPEIRQLQDELAMFRLALAQHFPQ